MSRICNYYRSLTPLLDDIEQTMLTKGAVLRKRQVRTADQFLRLIFAYAL